MATEATQDQVLDAARSLGDDGFTREDVAKKLGLDIADMRPGWKAAKEAGKLKKIDDRDGNRTFRLAE